MTDFASCLGVFRFLADSVWACLCVAAHYAPLLPRPPPTPPQRFFIRYHCSTLPPPRHPQGPRHR